MADYNREDHYYKKAKAEGYRSRAAYKLLEIQKKYAFIKPGFKVVDLGAWPGGWMQVASELVGRSGKVVGIDLVPIEEFGQENVKCITGNVCEEQVVKDALAFANGKFDVVLSDMSPKLSGIKEADRAGAVACAELAFWVSEQVLSVGGTLIFKAFKSNEAEEFIRGIRKRFQKLQRIGLDATRKTSNEFYVIGFGFA